MGSEVRIKYSWLETHRRKIMGLSPFKSAPNVTRVINGPDYEKENESLNKDRNVYCK